MTRLATQLLAASLLGLLALLGNLAPARADTACGIPGALTTLAGTGDEGLAGDGGAAGRARLSRPAGLAIDGAGNLYVADAGNNRIRKIVRPGAITTVVGGGPTGYLQGGFAGDGGPATEAELDAPSAVAVGPTGDLFVADSRNNRVRRIAADGTITTVAGNGTEGFGGDGGPAAEAELDFPTGLAVDQAGNLYIADTNNHRVRKVTADRTITTVAGSGPTGYLQGGLNGDGGPATAARLARPFGLAMDSVGGLYIADGFNNRIRRVTPGGIITTVAGSGPTGYLQGGLAGDGGPATAARLNFPRAVVLDAAGNLYVADALNHRVRRVGPDGIIHTIVGSGPTGYLRGSFAGDGGPPSDARLAFPAGLALDPGGVLYVADEENHRIRALTPCPAGRAGGRGDILPGVSDKEAAMTRQALTAVEHDFHERMHAAQMYGLWELASQMTRHPEPKAVPHMWKASLIEALIRESGEVVPVGEERRALQLFNPGLDGRWATTNTMIAAVQLLLPGEVARAHRHTPTAIRFIMEGEGAYTAVDGERVYMAPGDLILTPSWAWHDHGNGTDTPVIWMDGLDVPLVQFLNAMFFQFYDAREFPLSKPSNASVHLHGHVSLSPTWVKEKSRSSPLLLYSWEKTWESLRGLRDAGGDAHDGIALEYTHPQTGRSVLPTMGCWIQMLRPGERLKAHRHTGSAVYYVVQGTGETIIDGCRFPWGKGDIITLPAWALHEHANLSTRDVAVLFSIQDRPVLEALGLYQEEALSENDGHQAVTSTFEA